MRIKSDSTMKKKLNKSQRERRGAAFAATRPRGRELHFRNTEAPDHVRHISPFENLYPLEEPVPIAQIHPRGATGRKAVIATTKIPAGEPDRFGMVAMRTVPVCRHRCTFINTRHQTFVAA